MGPKRLTALTKRVLRQAVNDGYNIIILSDRAVSARAGWPIPALLATSSSVHHHLIQQRACAPLSGCWWRPVKLLEVNQFATLGGYGAEAVNPYMAFDTIIETLLADGLMKRLTLKTPANAIIKAVDKGLVEGDVQNGHFDLPVLLRCADL